jgi:hypothetical protein
MSENLPEGIVSQCRRCRDLVKLYETIPAGLLGKLAIEAAIREGEDALASGDAVRMVAAYAALESCE